MRMTIALDYLRRDRSRLQPEARANLLFDLWREMSEDPHRS